MDRSAGFARIPNDPSRVRRAIWAYPRRPTPKPGPFAVGLPFAGSDRFAVNEAEQIDRVAEVGIEDPARDVEQLEQLGVGDAVDDRRPAALGGEDVSPPKDRQMLSETSNGGYGCRTGNMVT
jgi:hypothetical protein